ncbi:hypothetical protein HHI36_017128 [Cryptolaemus montrouzieri]|uniref:Uncharacterized protein n=1 Tax=Cryptolaemus montrouzieri TaxID=559131 RepID=A0ABD2NM06_9CUCU
MIKLLLLSFTILFFIPGAITSLLAEINKSISVGDSLGKCILKVGTTFFEPKKEIIIILKNWKTGILNIPKYGFGVAQKISAGIQIKSGTLILLPPYRNVRFLMFGTDVSDRTLSQDEQYVYVLINLAQGYMEL